MKSQPDLGELYTEAKKARASKDYDRAAEALKQILVVDENYKDASRLLAQIIRIKRRRWYNDMRIWGPVIGVAALGLLLWLAPKIALPARAEPTATFPVTSPTTIVTTLPLQIPTVTPSPMPTAIPLQWKRHSMGLEFPRDQVTVIAVDPDDREVMYVGTMNAGVYGSINAGESWQPLHNGLRHTMILNLVIDPSDPKILYAGVASAAVYKSTDRGQTWVSAGQGLPGMGDTTCLLIDHQDGQHLYYAGIAGLYESLDGAGSWSQINDLRLASVAIDPGNGNILYALAEINGIGGLHRSEDRGQSWTVIGPADLRDGPDHYYFNGDVWVHPENGKIIFATVPDRLGTVYLIGTFDGGVNWYRFLDSYVEVLAFGPENSSLVFTGSWAGGVYSNDIIEGRRIILGTIGEDPVSAIFFLPEQNRLLASSQGLYSFIYSTVGEWSGQNAGLPATRLELLQSASQGDKFLETIKSVWNSSPHIYRSRDGYKSWSLFLYGSNLSFDRDGVTMYRKTNRGESQVSRNSGAVWNDISNYGSLLIANPYTPGAVFSFVYDSPIRYSSDYGSTWEDSSGLVLGYNQLAFFTAEEDELIYALDDEKMIRSADAGKTWQNCRYIEAEIPLYRSILAFTAGDERRLFAGTMGNGIFRSDDDCRSWEQVSTELGNLFVNTIAIDPNEPQTLYAGTNVGAYISIDGGDTWQEINDGLLGATVVYSIVVEADGSVYAATPYGVFILVSK